MEKVTPELALVDPELAAQARLSLPVPPVPVVWVVTVAPDVGRALVAQELLPDLPPVRTACEATIDLEQACCPPGPAAQDDLVPPVRAAHAEPSVSSSVPGEPSVLAAVSGAGAAQPGSRRPCRFRPVPGRLALVSALMALVALFGPLVVSGVSRSAEADAADPTSPRPTTAPSDRGHDIRWEPVPGASSYNLVLVLDGARALDLWPLESHAHLPTGSLTPGRYAWFAYPAQGAGEHSSFGPVAARGFLTIPETSPPIAGGG